MTTVKTEGFHIPGGSMPITNRSYRQPFTDGSMAIETDLLMDSNNSFSPFSFPQSLPNQPSIDQFMTSPHQSSSLDLDVPHGFNMFHNFKMDNPEPPICFPPDSSRAQNNGTTTNNARSHSISTTNRSATHRRKSSMSDTRPPVARGRPMHPHPRTMSHSDVHPRFGALGTHKEGQRTDSISPPEMYGIPIPRQDTWNVPSLFAGSFGSLPDEAIMDSPITPVQELAADSYKKQRRRECHNQVEKRRREHINAKIEELSQLLPPHYHRPEENAVIEEEEEETVGSPIKKKKTKRSGSSTAAATKDAAHCKGRILSQSVQYIYDLKDLTAMQAARIQHLESLLPSVPNFAWNAAPSSMPLNASPGLDSISSNSFAMPFSPDHSAGGGSASHARRSSSMSMSDNGMASEARDDSGRLSQVDMQLAMPAMDMDMFSRDEVRW